MHVLPSRSTLAAFAALLFATFLGLADAAAQSPFTYNFTEAVMEGEEARVTFRANIAIDSLFVEIKPKKGKKISFNRQSMGVGDETEFKFVPPNGTTSYTMNVSGSTPDGDLSGSATFTISTMAPFKITPDLKTIDFKNGKLSVSGTRGIARIEFGVYADEKKEIDVVEVDLGGGDSTVVVEWKPSDDKPVLMQLRAYDTYDMWAEVAIFRLEIPHEDLVFDSGAHAIREDQEHKLTSTLEFIEKAMGTYDNIAIELYIAGYTDTVGKPADNKALSEKRAKSIAKWFRKSGIRIPTYYAGFGESVLAVPTEDETDNEANRRAIYILSNSAPQAGSFPGANWRKVN